MDYFCWRGAPDKRDFWENFANYKFNSPIEDDITEKRKVRMVELIFLLVSRNVVFFFNAAPSDFCGPWHQGKECATIFIASTIEFCFG